MKKIVSIVLLSILSLCLGCSFKKDKIVLEESAGITDSHEEVCKVLSTILDAKPKITPGIRKDNGVPNSNYGVKTTIYSYLAEELSFDLEYYDDMLIRISIDYDIGGVSVDTLQELADYYKLGITVVEPESIADTFVGDNYELYCYISVGSDEINLVKINHIQYLEQYRNLIPEEK